MRPDLFVGAVEALADECDRTQLPDDAELLNRLTAATSRIVMWEFEGLAERIKASKVNGTPRPVPVKPAPQPRPPSDPKPGK